MSPSTPAPTRQNAGDYVLGTDEQELARLSFQHHVWSSTAYELWRRAGFTVGQTLLDLGAGPGYASVDLAGLAGARGRVLAVEPSPRFAAALRAQRPTIGSAAIEVIEAVGSALGVARESVDGAFARWVLCFIEDPAAVLADVRRALRPGARLVIQDYVRWRHMQLAPPSAAFECMCDAAVQSIARSGGDFEIGARLPRLLRKAGFEVEWIEPIVRLARPGSLEWEWAATFFDSYVPRLVGMQLLSAVEADAFRSDWAAHSADPDAFLLTPPMVAICARRL